MKKLLKGLFLTVFAVSSATTTTNKIFLMPRSQGANLAMEYATYNELVQHNNGDFFGANFQIVPFYMESSDKSDIGKYFGINNRNNIRLANNAAVVINSTADFEYNYMIHDYNQDDGIGTINFKPELQAYGARIDYYQDLEKILEGLYLKIALPIVHIENDMHLSTAVSTESTSGIFTKTNLDDYFRGNYVSALAGTNAQESLEYAKINGSHSETSVADIDAILGYKLLEKDNYYVSLNIGLTIPVGNTSDGTWVFEPIVGNGNHWGFGGGLDASVKLWENDNQNIKLTGAMNYRYLFEGTEKRTLGLKNPNGTSSNWGQYLLAGKIGAAINAQQLRPVANLLTQNVDIESASQFDSIIYFTYNNGGLTIDFGYNFFWKDDEKVNLKNEWTDGAYGIASITQNMSIAPDGGGGANGLFSVTNANATTALTGGSIGYINKVSNNAALPAQPATTNPAPTATTAFGIDTSAAETPSQNTHKIFGELGYIFKDWDYPVMLGIGGGYEFAPDDGIENWQIFGKLGIKF